MTLSDAQLDRYARHIVLRDIGGSGQAKLLDSHVLLIGAGGIGCPAIQYLAAAGVGTISVVDDDVGQPVEPATAGALWRGADRDGQGRGSGGGGRETQS